VRRTFAEHLQIGIATYELVGINLALGSRRLRTAENRDGLECLGDLDGIRNASHVTILTLDTLLCVDALLPLVVGMFETQPVQGMDDGVARGTEFGAIQELARLDAVVGRWLFWPLRCRSDRERGVATFEPLLTGRLAVRLMQLVSSFRCLSKKIRVFPIH
jgi:hypothetical protein